MDAHELVDAMMDALSGSTLEAEMTEAAVEKVRTFSDAGLLTRDAGIVLTLDDGSEFQLTVVRSR